METNTGPDLEKLRKSYVWAWEEIEEAGRTRTADAWAQIATLVKAEMKTEKDNRDLEEMWKPRRFQDRYCADY